jgi:hypothetical protein
MSKWLLCSPVTISLTVFFFGRRLLQQLRTGNWLQSESSKSTDCLPLVSIMVGWLDIIFDLWCGLCNEGWGLAGSAPRESKHPTCTQLQPQVQIWMRFLMYPPCGSHIDANQSPLMFRPTPLSLRYFTQVCMAKNSCVFTTNKFPLFSQGWLHSARDLCLSLHSWAKPRAHSCTTSGHIHVWHRGFHRDHIWRKLHCSPARIQWL